MMKNKIERAEVKTAWGSFHLEATDKGLCRVRFPKQVKEKGGSKRFKAQNPHLKQAKRLLESYFKGKRVSFQTLKLDLRPFTPFQKKIYKKLSRVPRGKVVTYQQLAKTVGHPRAYRAVGSTMNRNRMPVVLPCHRVVGRSGDLCGYSAGLAWKRRLIALEKTKRHS